MAITLKSTKGTALTHNEMDDNLSEFFHSGSITDQTLTLFTYGTGSTFVSESMDFSVNAGSGIISSSVLASTSQGTARLNLNNVNGSDVDLGLQTTDDVTFADITSNGQVHINTGSAFTALKVTGSIDLKSDSSAHNGHIIISSSGVIFCDNVQDASDESIKSQIIRISNSLDTLKQFQSYEFVKNGKQSAGFLAQEVKEVLPFLTDRVNGLYSLNYTPIIAYLHRAILELDERLQLIEPRR